MSSSLAIPQLRFSSTDDRGFVNNNSPRSMLSFFHLLQSFFSLLNLPKQLLGNLIRDRLFLPFNFPDQIGQWDIQGSQLLLDWLMGEKDIPATCSNHQLLQNIKRHFRFTPKEIRVKTADKGQTFVFKTYFIESKNSISGKGLTYILVSFYEHEVITKNAEKKQTKPWLPENLKYLSGMLPAILMTLKKNNITVDSLHLFSLGGVTLESLKTTTMIDILPKTLILNRTFTSTEKVITALFFLPMRPLLNILTWITGWNANPEQTILSFFAKHKDSSSLEDRTCVIFQATKDHYFGGKSSFAPDFESRLRQTGLKVFSGKFYAINIPLRAQHASNLTNFVARKDSQDKTGTDRTHFLPMEAGESIAHAFAKLFLVSEDKDRHVCLNIGGSQETLALMVESTLPILTEFLEIKRTE